MTNPDTDALVTPLGWDSGHFGLSIARIADNAAPTGDLDTAYQWCAKNDVDVAYLLCSAANLAIAHRASQLGFRLVDLRLTFAMPIHRWAANARTARATVRPTIQSDIATLVEIARTAHRDTRFRADGRFAPDKCDEVYSNWLASAIDGAADAVFTAIHGDKPVGYVTAHLDPSEAGLVGRIGLIAVAEQARGSGAGRALVHHACEWFSQNQVEELVVGTQGVNTGAAALYESSGYRLKTVDTWYHAWLDRDQR